MNEPIHPLQAMADGLGAAWQKDRSKTQMTLGQLIALLSGMPADARVTGLGALMSYRGYYCDLSFEPLTQERPVADLLAECRDAMGRVFHGYKGGDFMMGESTPLWVSEYGLASDARLMGLDVADNLARPIIAPQEDRDR